MKKKIAILTLPIGMNYGGVIQNYALQAILINMGYSVVTIDREYKKPSCFRKLLSKIKNETINRVKGRKRKIFTDKEKRHVNSNISDFIEKNIHITDEIVTSNGLKKLFQNNSFDAIIVGSDQTWRPRYAPDIYNYFFDFLIENKHIRKIAYATSFGVSEWEYSDEQTVKCKQLVKGFKAVSVREDSGINLCKNYLNVNADLVLDPTLLLSKEQYISLLSKELMKKRGIFSYVLDSSYEKMKFVNDVSHRLSLEVFSNQPKRSTADTINFSTLEDYVYPSIESWIGSFYEADFIITDSYHGTIFAIIFNKPFLTILNEARGGSRFHSLLDQLGLSNRLISNLNDYNVNLLYEKINYEHINMIIKDLRNKSFNFLEENIK